MTYSQSKTKYDYRVCSYFNFVLLLGVALHLSTFVTHFDRSRENTLEYWTVNHENLSLISKSFFLCKTLLRDRSPIIALSCQSLTDWFTIYSLLILWCVSRPLPNKTRPKFQSLLKLLPWVRCAFVNVLNIIPSDFPLRWAASTMTWTSWFFATSSFLSKRRRWGLFA